MTSKKNLLLCLVLISSLGNIHAQKPLKKFGDIDIENLKMKSCDLDTNASAVVLFEWGVTKIVYQANDLDVEFTHHKRIKILNSEGFDQADVEISYRRDRGIQRLKASTYNLMDGKVVESEVKKDAIFTEETSEYSNKKKFSFPDIKEGSILEFSYQKKVGSIARLNTWYFQTSIPTILSEYYVIFPEWLNYKELMTGYEILTENEKRLMNLRLGDSNVTGSEYHYVINNVPAFKEEPYMNSKKNYISKIDFELESINIPGQIFQEVLGTYSSINKDFIEDPDFGQQIKENKYFEELTQSICMDKVGFEKANAIYDFVRQEIRWNNEIKLFAQDNLKKIVEENEGSSADINLLLVTLLRNGGFTANPVIYSTRSNGTLHPIFAIVSRFNDVLACVELDGKEYLLDGTDEFQPFNMIPNRSLNGEGLIISATGSRWIPLEGIGTYDLLVSGKFQLDDIGTLEGDYSVTRKGYDAVELRGKIKNDGKDKYLEKIRENAPEWNIDSFELNDLEDISKPILEVAAIQIENGAESIGDIIYLNPIITERVEENPFKLENRKFPVDFGCEQSKTWIFQFTIPEGFIVDEIPVPVALALPGKDGIFQYSATQIGNTLQVMSRLTINKAVFLPDEYEFLKEFFNQVAKKQSETVVLKRKT